MSANDKVAATFHGEETTHNPCCSSHGVNMTCETYRRTHFVEVGACCGKWVEPDRTCDHSESLHGRCVSCGKTWEQQAEERLANRTPEQELGMHIGDLLSDIDHFNGCTDSPCTCLVGRLRWAINAEQVTPDQTTAAIDTMARHLIGVILYAADFGGDMWEHIPEVGAHDFEAITKRVQQIADGPTTEEFDDAYAHLRTRVDGAA